MPDRYVVRLSLADAVNRLRRTAGELSSRTPDRSDLRLKFAAHLARNVLDRVHQGFTRKSLWVADSLGNRWPPLRPATIRWRLSPSVVRRWPLAARLWMLRVSDRLYQSMAPGMVQGASYIPPHPDQYASISPTKVEVGTLVSYAEYQAAKGRPIFPRDMDQWVQEAAREAMETVLKDAMS